MKIVLRTQPMAPTEAIKASVDSCLHDLKTSLPLTKAEVYMTTENRHHITLIRLHGRHLDLVARTHASNMYQALKKTVDKLTRQLQKKKG